MGIVVKQSDSLLTLKRDDQIQSEFTVQPNSVNRVVVVQKEIRGKRRVSNKLEYLIGMGEDSQWIAYSNEWPIADQQLALEFEKATQSSAIDNTATPSKHSNDSVISGKELIIPVVPSLSSIYNQDSILVDYSKLNTDEIIVPNSRKQWILDILSKNSEFWLSQLPKLSHH